MNSSPESTNLLIKTLSTFTKIPVEHIHRDREITELVADSFLLIELMLNLQESLDIALEQEDLEQVHTVGDLLDLLEQRLAGQALAV